MSAKARKRTAFILRDRTAGGRKMQEGILIEVLARDQGLEVGFVACGSRERGVRRTKAWCRGIADCDVVVVPKGEHDLLVNGLGWHVGRGGKLVLLGAWP